MMKMGRGMREELVFYCCFLPVYGVVVGLSYGHVHCLLFTVTDVISHSLSVHPSLFDSVESCPQVELTLINTSAHLVLWYNGTGSCIPLPIRVLFLIDFLDCHLNDFGLVVPRDYHFHDLGGLHTSLFGCLCQSWN